MLPIGVLLMGCGSEEHPEASTFKNWKEDRFGCEGLRQEMRSDLDSLRKLLIGKNQDEIIYLLGKPEINELQSRSKSSFAYYINGSKECEDTLHPKTLFVLDFNSLNQVRFATVQRW